MYFFPLKSLLKGHSLRLIDLKLLFVLWRVAEKNVPFTPFKTDDIEKFEILCKTKKHIGILQSLSKLHFAETISFFLLKIKW